LYDDTNPPLQDSPSPFHLDAWDTLLQSYPGDLRLIITNILRFGALIGYEGPDRYILSKNLLSANDAPDVMHDKLLEDLRLRRVLPTIPQQPFISSPLGFAPKHDGGLRRIHHLSHPPGRSVNDGIPEVFASLDYVTFHAVLDIVVRAGRNCVIMKRDIKDAFRNIPLAPHIQWLLGFNWEDKFYKEACLPFGLRTAPFIFNLFAEGFHWILQSYLNWELLAHYLDDFIRAIPHDVATPDYLAQQIQDYIVLTDLLGIPRNDKKDELGQKVTVLGYLIDTAKMEARLPLDKLERARQAAAKATTAGSISLVDIQSLAGFLSFCSPVVRLGWVFMRRIWTFIASYPTSSKFAKRRIPSGVMDDLEWWKQLLPNFNGVLFFDTDTREAISLYTDASNIGLGGFWYSDPHNLWWTNAISRVPSTQAFASPYVHPTMSKFDINIYELKAILIALQTWGPHWSRKSITVFTDSATAQSGLRRLTLKDPSENEVLRQILLLAAQHDIVLIPRWISGISNTLADALSRSHIDVIADICPHWQDPSFFNFKRHHLIG
jgi:Reverse transcriptase (RNA-dependent DNA polymerase)/RNase H-like domain found in reverse transcriptase